MNTHTYKNLLIRSSITLALALASWLPIVATAADEPMKPMKDGEHQMMPKDTATKPPMNGKMMKQCQAMMEQKKKMMADMKAQDTELTAQVAKMNSAPEDKKLDLVAAVVTQMVEQRTAMNARMAKMKDEMMNHMMEHMQMGKESMAQCPMMKGMDEKSAGDHKEH